MPLLEIISIDLSDPHTRGAITLAIAAWTVAVLVVVWNIGTDFAQLAREHTPKQRPQRERRFIEPCADGMHVYDDEGLTCTTCKQPKEPLP